MLGQESYFSPTFQGDSRIYGLTAKGERTYEKLLSASHLVVSLLVNVMNSVFKSCRTWTGTMNHCFMMEAKKWKDVTLVCSVASFCN